MFTSVGNNGYWEAGQTYNVIVRHGGIEWAIDYVGDCGDRTYGRAIYRKLALTCQEEIFDLITNESSGTIDTTPRILWTQHEIDSYKVDYGGGWASLWKEGFHIQNLLYLTGDPMGSSTVYTYKNGVWFNDVPFEDKYATITNVSPAYANWNDTITTTNLSHTENRPTYSYYCNDGVTRDGPYARVTLWKPLHDAIKDENGVWQFLDSEMNKNIEPQQKFCHFAYPNMTDDVGVETYPNPEAFGPSALLEAEETGVTAITISNGGIWTLTPFDVTYTIQMKANANFFTEPLYLFCPTIDTGWSCCEIGTYPWFPEILGL